MRTPVRARCVRPAGIPAARRTLAAGLLAVLAGGAGAATHVVEIERMAFGPMPAGVVAGDVIEWRNLDLVPHTATAQGVGIDVVLAPGQAASSTVSTPGKVEIVCSYHPGMRALLVVGASTATAGGAADGVP